MDRNVLIGIVIASVVLLLVVIIAIMRKRRSEHLRQRFGPEYQQVLQQHGDARHAEAVLEERERRVQKFSIRALPKADREHYIEEWANVQRRFVDDPALAINDAEMLVTLVMTARGYPMADFEQRAADISVNHPRVVENYRSGKQIVLRHGKGQATTEELRQAMVYYRSLFEDLLETRKADVVETQSRLAS